MKTALVRCFLLLLTVCFGWGCANIVPPAGGKKDLKAPRLLSVNPPDSQLHARVKKIDLRFDEYIVLSNPASEIQISPMLSTPLTVTSALKRVSIQIPDSLLLDSTTYRISLGRGIQDLHENNPFSGYTYSFSTGDYFDSLILQGAVIQAATGLPDTGAFVLLYEASASDSAVVLRTPLYVLKADALGRFNIGGLPPRNFRIYALQDKNANLIYDGGAEGIAFHEHIVHPGIDTVSTLVLRTFREKEDTASTADKPLKKGNRRDVPANRSNEEKDAPLTYQVSADTSNTKNRTHDVTKPLTIVAGRVIAAIDTGRIVLSYDSSGVDVVVKITIGTDTAARNKFTVNTQWKLDMVYTLRLLKGFIGDSANIESMPSRHSFRTKWEDDYARLDVHLPGRYQGNKHLLQVTRDQDTVWQKPVTDTIVRLTYLQPGSYTMRVILDENENGQWDTGDLFEKRQPERVIPYREPLQLKAGWENIIDFEEAPKRDALGKSPTADPPLQHPDTPLH